MHNKPDKIIRKNRTYVLTEVADTSLLKKPANKMVVTAPSRTRAREAASVADSFRPAVWLDPTRSTCELAPTGRTKVLCCNFDTGEG